MTSWRKIYSIFASLLILLSTQVFAASLGSPDIDDIEFPDEEPHGAKEVSLGKVLFFDTRLSSNDKQSCASCHNPDLGFGDGLAKGLGTQGNTLGRNTPHLYNLAWASTFFWDGRASTLEEQALGPIEAPGEMNMPLEQLLPKLKAVPFYQQAFNEIYGSSGITAQNIALAIAAFERSIIVDDTPFDSYMAGDQAAMSPAAVRGLALFDGKAKCTACHDGANFTDDSFHNLGIIDGDDGRAIINGTESLQGAFKTPGLRNALYTAPYMHDGSEATLEDVVRFYNQGGGEHSRKDKLMVPLELTDPEVSDLVAFLGALSSPLKIERPQIP